MHYKFKMQSSKSKKILAISGSLRAGSSNHAILRFLGRMALIDISYTIYDNLAQIPPFDPGLDNEHPPEAVMELRGFINHAMLLLSVLRNMLLVSLVSLKML